MPGAKRQTAHYTRSQSDRRTKLLPALLAKHQAKIRFLMVGGFNALLDLILFSLLANLLHFPPLAASMISTSICITVSFFLNYHFVWKSAKSLRHAAPRFVIVSLFSAWVVQTTIIWLITSLAGNTDLINFIAKLAGMACGTLTNYFGYRLIFR